MPKFKTIGFASEEASSFKINTIPLKSILVFAIAFVGCSDKDGDKSKSSQVNTSQVVLPAKEISIEEMSFEQLYGCKKLECYDEYKKRLKSAVAYVDSVYAEGTVGETSQLSTSFYFILRSDGSTVDMKNEAPTVESIAKRIEKLYPPKGCIEDSVQYVHYFSTIYEVEKNLQPDDENAKKIFKKYFGYLNKNCKLRHYDENILAMEERFVTNALKRKDITVAKAQNLRNDMRKGEILVDERDGKKYKTVKIGQQVWMAENLNHALRGSLCYKESVANCRKYGRLYEWQDALRVCPDGWHLPSVNDFAILIENAGSEISGKTLKSTSGWSKKEGRNCNGSDDYGFAVLPGGGKFIWGGFSDISKAAFFWTSTTKNEENSYYMYLRTSGMKYLEDDDRIWNNNECNAIGIISAASKASPNAFSVRCLKD